MDARLTSSRSMTTPSYPMTVQSIDPVGGTTWVDMGEGHKVTIQGAAPTVQRDQSVLNGAMVAHTETREMMTPLVSMPQRTGGTSRVEDMQPIVTTRSYETIRRDVSEVFPGSNIIAVLPPQQTITTPLGGTYTPVTRGFEATPISPNVRSAFPTYQSSRPMMAPTSIPTYISSRPPGSYYPQTMVSGQHNFSSTSPQAVSATVPIWGASRFPISSPVHSTNVSPTSYGGNTVSSKVVMN